jgi:hypothetical protein
MCLAQGDRAPAASRSATVPLREVGSRSIASMSGQTTSKVADRASTATG